MKALSWFISAALVLGALYVLVWGPRPLEVIPVDRRSDVIIQYWEKWTGNEASQMKVIVDDFNNSVGREKHIYVQYLSISNVDQKTLVSTAGGVPPDIAGIWHNTLAQFAALGALEPLEDLAAEHGIGEGYYQRVFWEGCHFNGHLYGLISTPGAVALFYNKRIFRENAGALRAAGLDPDRAPRSLGELDRYAEVLNTWMTGADGRRHLARAGYLPMEPGWYVTDTPLWFGTDVWDPARERFILTDERVVAAFEWIQSYSLRLGSDAVTEFSSAQGGFNTPQNAFMAGTVAMEQQGPWMANFIHDQKPQMDQDWAAAPFPSAVAGLEDVTFCPFDVLAIPRGCRHKAEAFEFIAYVNQQAVMEKLCSMQCKNSPLSKVSEDFLSHHGNRYIRVFEELAASANAHTVMKCPIEPEVGAELLAMTQRLVALTLDPDSGQIITARQALEKTQQRVALMWEYYLRKQARRRAAE